MGVDIAVTFLKEHVKVGRLLGELCAAVTRVSPGFDTYAFVKSVEGVQGFCLYLSDENFDLNRLNAMLAHSLGELCTIWKSEHGGCSGKAVYRPGEPAEHDGTMNDQGGDGFDDYMDYPCVAFERTFGLSLDLTDEDELFFPDSFLDHAGCYRISAAGPEKLSQKEKSKVWDHETEAEEVLPRPE
ncbi:MAG: hypothetical protein AB1696_28760 [Planctomycetota bacterium]